MTDLIDLSKYADLEPIGNGKDGLVTAAKNIRIELKKNFPGVKFSVKTSRFSMGDSIHVSWTDGPTTKQVDATIDKYAAGDFDGMTDCYNYTAGTFNKVFGDAKYVSSSRHYSDKLVEQVLTGLCRQFGITPSPTAEDYRQGRLWMWAREQQLNFDFERQLHIALQDSSPAA